MRKQQPDQGLGVYLAGASAHCAAQSVLAWQMTQDIYARDKRPAFPWKKRDKQPQPRATTIAVAEP